MQKKNIAQAYGVHSSPPPRAVASGGQYLFLHVVSAFSLKREKQKRKKQKRIFVTNKIILGNFF